MDWTSSCKFESHRAQAQNDTGHRSGGRRGVCGPDGGCSCRLVSKIYLSVIGGWPQEEEDPTVEQVSALQRRIQVQDAAPFVDFAIWVPYRQRAMKAAKFRSFVLTASGYATKELPGPSTFVQWRTSCRILRTALIVLDAASLAALHNGHRQADEDLPDSLAPHLCSGRTCAVGPLQPSQGEGAHGHEGRENTASKLGSEKALGLCLHDDCGGRQLLAYASPRPGFDLDGSWKPWYSPEEQLATAFMTGGVSITLQTETEGKDDGEGFNSRKIPRPNRRRRNGAGGESDSGGGRVIADDNNKKGSGKTKQKCFAWNNGNGACANLPPGQACAAKVKREHRCTICNSLGHPSMSCPNKNKK